MKVMAVVILMSLVICGLVAAGPIYTKVDDATVGVSEDVKVVSQYTLSELDREIEGCESDIAKMDEMKAKILARKTSLEETKAQAVVLGVVESIVKPIDEEPIE